MRLASESSIILSLFNGSVTSPSQYVHMSNLRIHILWVRFKLILITRVLPMQMKSPSPKCLQAIALPPLQLESARRNGHSVRNSEKLPFIAPPELTMRIGSSNRHLPKRTLV